MSRYSEADIAALVEEDRVHRDVYTSPEIFRLEMDRLWSRAWIYIGHESQVARPGDYYATTLGTKPVVMVRGDDGQVRVLFNRCPHKGAQMVGEQAGHVKFFRCSYHGYAFKTDGSIHHIPVGEDYDNTRFDTGNPCFRMLPVPRVDSYRGLVFASLAAEGPALAHWLGGAASSIDNLADRSPEGELEVWGGPLRYLHDCNWKMFIENLNDAMHPMVVHHSSAGTARQFAEPMRKRGETLPFALEMLGPFASNYEFFQDMGVSAFDYGHSYMGGDFSIHSDYSEVPGYTDKMRARYGEEKLRSILGVNRHNTVVYPSFTLKGAIQSVRVVRPIAVNRTLVESWVLALKGAPEEMNERSITYCNIINSSANLVGPDDYEAYHRMQHGLAADGNEWISQHRLLGQEESLPEGGYRAPGLSDLSFRNQFRAWKHYMLDTEAA
jgi:benzoate/toluate 1,2-dioxygenase subunit alpha